MLHQNLHIVSFILFTILVSVTFSTAVNSRAQAGVEVTECDVIRRISHVCYQCSKRHDEDFNTVYTACCSGRESDSSIREYCEAIYTEPPKRGGLWI